MKAATFFILAGILCTALASCNTLKYSVLFGDRSIKDQTKIESEKFLGGKVVKNISSHVVRMYFDREGILYPMDCYVPPDFLISNNYTFLVNDSTLSSRVDLRQKLSTLSKSSDFKPYAKLYEDTYTHFGNRTKIDSTTADRNSILKFKEDFDNLSLQKYGTILNGLVAAHGYTNVTFIMVGFNNTLINQDYAFNSSETKLRLLRLEIQSILDSYNATRDPVLTLKKTLFVEVHWDGKFNEKQGVKTGLSYRPALRTTYKVGLTLRKFINLLDNKSVQINLLSHSSGANIVCEVMFNQISKIPRKGKENELWEYLNTKYTTQHIQYATPDTGRHIVAGLLAPSIPGKETFIDYYNRTGVFKEDKYRVVIGYNLNDVALRKKFRNFGLGFLLSAINSKDRLIKQVVFTSTALGCLQKEVNDVSNLFRKSYALENIRFVNFTFTETSNYKAANAVHPVEQYIKVPQYREFIKAVYQLE